MQPSWFRVISWSDAITIETLNLKRSDIPEGPGFYVFSHGPGVLTPGTVIYIGESKNLRNRLPVYLVHDPTTAKLPPHKGAILVRGERTESVDADRKICVRWSEFEGDRMLRRYLERALIQFFDPPYNERDWVESHPFE